MGIKFFSTLSPKLTAKIISFILAFSITVAGFTCTEALFGKGDATETEEGENESADASNGANEVVADKIVFDTDIILTSSGLNPLIL